MVENAEGMDVSHAQVSQNRSNEPLILYFFFCPSRMTVPSIQSPGRMNQATMVNQYHVKYAMTALVSQRPFQNSKSESESRTTALSMAGGQPPVCSEQAK